MKRVNTKASKRIVAVVLAAVAAISVMGCSVEKNFTSTTTHTYTDANGNTVTTTITNHNGEESELITYEFETYDGVKVVIDENSIVAQEASEDPEYSDLVSEEARGNIIAPGRDFVYLEDENNYYVADLSRNLITVADKSMATI